MVQVMDPMEERERKKSFKKAEIIVETYINIQKIKIKLP